MAALAIKRERLLRYTGQGKAPSNFDGNRQCYRVKRSRILIQLNLPVYLGEIRSAIPCPA